MKSSRDGEFQRVRIQFQARPCKNLCAFSLRSLRAPVQSLPPSEFSLSFPREFAQHDKNLKVCFTETEIEALFFRVIGVFRGSPFRLLIVAAMTGAIEVQGSVKLPGHPPAD